MATPPSIGSFRTVPNNEPRRPPETAPSDEKVIETEPVDTKEPLKLTPAETYAKLLKEHNIELKEARAIIDDVIVNGFYQESFTLLGRKATFKTRAYGDQLRVNKALELENPTHSVTVGDLVVRHNLAASLTEWANNKYPSPRNEEEFQARLAALEFFSAPLINLLSNQLAKFDTKMMVVFSDGCIDSF